MVSIGGIIGVGSASAAAGAASGIQTIDPGGNVGPTVEFQGVNGVEVTSPSSNVILLDAAGVSGVAAISRFVSSFFNQTDVTFTHNFGRFTVLVQVYAAGLPGPQILPDRIEVVDGNNVRVTFNTPQSGRVIIVG